MPYGVFEHCNRRQPTGTGYVARELDTSLKPLDAYNYGDVEPLHIFSRRAAAEAWCKRANGGRVS